MVYESLKGKVCSADCMGSEFYCLFSFERVIFFTTWIINLSTGIFDFQEHTVLSSCTKEFILYGVDNRGI